MKKNIDENKRKRDEKRRQALAQLTEFNTQFSDESIQSAAISLEQELLYPTRRQDIEAPPPVEKSAKNPDGIVDILVFCEHPYYLNQRLMPWQKMILKLFYAGTAGNTHLAYIDEGRPTNSNDCTGCVWQYVKESEEKHARGLIAFENDQDKLRILPEPNMLIENSPCMNCSRYNDVYRQRRFEHKISNSIRQSEIKEIEVLKARPIEDNFKNEMDLMQDDYVDDKNITKKVKDQIFQKIGERFQELILVLGRRSGKSYLVSMIALYETYRFLAMGHPQKRFPIMEFDTITICNVAVSESQAKAAIFDKIKALATTSPYFIQHIGKAPTQLDMYFLTDHDKEENARRKEMGLELLEGTIVLISGHSNSASLVGRTMAVIIIDEMAEMAGSKEDGGTDSDLYSKLKPSIATFGREGKIICISNPLAQKGKFFELYNNAFNDNSMLMFQLPTWKANPNIEKTYLNNEKLKDPDTFDVFYGAQFANIAKDPFLPEHIIDAAFNRGMDVTRAEEGHPLIRYYAHLDPAESSDNYTLAVVHAEPSETPGLNGEPQTRIVVDHLHIWRPVGGHPIDSTEVEQYILKLASKYKFAQVSFDQWNSQSSIAKLLANGVNAVRTTFNKAYKDVIYSELYELFTRNLIDFYAIDTDPIYEVKECRTQFKWLRRFWQGKIPKIQAASGFHDDFPDAIASAAYQALKNKTFARLPRTTSMRIGGFR